MLILNVIKNHFNSNIEDATKEPIVRLAVKDNSNVFQVKPKTALRGLPRGKRGLKFTKDMLEGVGACNLRHVISDQTPIMVHLKPLKSCVDAPRV